MNETANKSQHTYKKNSQWKEIFKRLSKNRMAVIGLVIITIVSLAAIFADIIAPYGYDAQNLKQSFLPPCREYILGTDNLGRDTFSRIIYGARVSLVIGLSSALFSAFTGTLTGAISGYYGGRVDNTIMRILDVFMAIPSVLLAIAIAAGLGSGMFSCIAAIGISHTPGVARIVRASFLSEKSKEYIEAAHSINATDMRVIFRHILPNTISPLIVKFTLEVAMGILMAASMSFLGIGIKAPTPEWGAMLSAGRPFIRDYPSLVVFPGIAIMVTLLSLNLLGDGLRDAMDPRLKD